MPNLAAIAAIDAFGAFSDAVTQVSDDAGNRLLDKGGAGEAEGLAAGIAPFSASPAPPAPLQAVLADTDKAGADHRDREARQARRGDGVGAARNCGRACRPMLGPARSTM